MRSKCMKFPSDWKGLIAGKPAPTLECIHNSKCGSWLVCDSVISLTQNKRLAQYMANFQPLSSPAQSMHEYLPLLLPKPRSRTDSAGHHYLPAGRYGEGRHRPGLAHCSHGHAWPGYAAGAGCGIADHSFDCDQPVATVLWRALGCLAQTPVADAVADFSRHRAGHLVARHG